MRAYSLPWNTLAFLCLCFFNVRKCPKNVYLNMSNTSNFVKGKQYQINLRISGPSKAKWYLPEPNVQSQSSRTGYKVASGFL